MHFFSVVFHSNVYIFLKISVDLFFINYKKQCELVAVFVARQMNVNVLVLETNLKSLLPPSRVYFLGCRVSHPLLLDAFVVVLELCSLQAHAVGSSGLPGHSDTVLNSLAGFPVLQAGGRAPQHRRLFTSTEVGRST